MPTAWLRTSTWLGPGWGVGTSSSFRTEGPPYSETRIAFMVVSSSPCKSSLGEWIGTELELHDLAGGALVAFEMERGAGGEGRPHRPPLPAGLGIVDAPVHALGVEAHRVRHAQVDELAVDQREQRLVGVAGGERHVLAEPERVVLVHPAVVAGLGASRLAHVGELRTGERVERPALRAVLAGRIRSVERALALAAIEAREVTAGQRRPHHPVAVDVHAARGIAGRRRLVDLGQGGRGRVRARIE